MEINRKITNAKIQVDNLEYALGTSNFMDIHKDYQWFDQTIEKFQAMMAKPLSVDKSFKMNRDIETVLEGISVHIMSRHGLTEKEHWRNTLVYKGIRAHLEREIESAEDYRVVLLNGQLLGW